MDIKRWKLLKAVVVDLLVFILGLFSIHQGADPTVTGIAALSVIGLHNGLELSELVALYSETNVDESDP